MTGKGPLNLYHHVHSGKLMENGPFEDDFLIENGNIPLLC